MILMLFVLNKFIKNWLIAKVNKFISDVSEQFSNHHYRRKYWRVYLKWRGDYSHCEVASFDFPFYREVGRVICAELIKVAITPDGTLQKLLALKSTAKRRRNVRIRSGDSHVRVSMCRVRPETPNDEWHASWIRVRVRVRVASPCNPTATSQVYYINDDAVIFNWF